MKRLAYVGLAVLFPSAVFAQATPALSVSGGAYTLTVPYLEYGSGASKQAYSATLTSTTLASFLLDASSVKVTPLLSAPSYPATFGASGGSYRLALPYVEYTAPGVFKAYSAALTTKDLKNFAIDTSSLQEIGVRGDLASPGSVTVSETTKQTVGGNSFGSSSKLSVSWSAPSGYTVDHYEISASETLMNTSASTTATGSATSATLTALKAATTYSVVVKACKDSACASYGKAAAVSATTPGEYWQLQGTGNTVSTLTQPVSDGNARLSATRFGAEAGAMANTVQFYYGPKGVSGMAMAASGAVSAATPASYLTFTSYAGSSGLRSPSSATSGIKSIMTGQGVPLSTALGAKVRLFFESNDADGKTRIYSVDSVDGYVGRDFNSGSATTCTTSADYLAGGACPATVVIGVEGDSVNPTSKISAARQNKIAYPTLTDWRWDGAAGTFMVFTVDQISGCTTNSHNHAYAVWDGGKFVVQYDSSGCPKMFKSAQAALPMHIGGARYKMYFGDPSVSTGKTSGSTLPFVGPKKLIYADGSTSGSAATVEYEDWEGVANARNVVFLWPNGDQMNDTAEGYIDDFHFLTPTGSLDLQVLYLSITDGSVVPFAAAAILLNP